MTTQATPTIHLNGTDGAVLRDTYRAAHDAMRVAMTALSDAAPNERDYYVQTPNGFSDARKQHEARVAALQKIDDELTEILCAIEDHLDP